MPRLPPEACRLGGSVRRTCIVFGCVTGVLWIVTAWLWATDGAPRPIVERTVRNSDRYVRLSVFDNGLAVVMIRENDRVTLHRRMEMAPAELDVYRDVIEREAIAVAKRGTGSGKSSEGGWTSVTVYRRDGAVQTFGYSPLFGVSVHVGRLTMVLDEIERRVVERRPEEEAVRAWAPEVGDRVEMMNGPVAVVVEVREDGTVVLEHLDSPIVEVFMVQDAPMRVRRVVEEK